MFKWIYSMKNLSINDANSVREYFENIIALLPGHIFWKDLECRFLGCNDKQAQIAGLSSRHEIIGLNSIDVISKNQPKELRKKQAMAIDAIDMKIMRSGIPETIEEPFVTEEGEERIFLSQKVPIKDSEDKVIGLLGIAIDITEQKRMERELSRARDQAELANKAKSAFLANISHDTRTPLSGIITLSEAMMKDSKLLTIENIIHINKSSQSLLDMMNKVLDFIRIESPDFRELQKAELFSISQLVDDVFSLYRPSFNTKKIKFKINIAKNMPPCLFSKPFFIYKIFVNLIGNALKFTEKGYVSLDVWLKGRKFCFSITDTGSGIPDKEKAKIFEWFEKLNPSYKSTLDGMGLGLALVKTALEDLNGNIQVLDNKDGGTIFSGEIPIEIPSSVDKKNTDIPPIGSSRLQQNNTFKEIKLESKKYILLVEDSEIAGMAAKLVLEQVGFVVDWVKTGQDGLAAILAGKYNMFILDIGLPDMAGDEVIVQARIAGTKEPAYALTGHADIDREELIAKGFTEVMVKPLDIKSFLDFIKENDDEFELGKSDIKIVDLNLGENFGFDKRQAKEILATFIAGLDIDVQDLKKAIEKTDIKKLQNILHRIKGGASYACVPKLDTELKIAHSAIKAGDVLNLEELFNPLFLAIEELIEVFEKGSF